MYILRKSLERSPTVTTNDESNVDETDQDEAMKLDDNGFLHPTDSDNEEAV